MEELTIDFGLTELEEVKKKVTKFNFPVAHIGSSIVFNKCAADTGLVGEAIKWFTASDYVVGIPGKQSEKNAFKTTKSKGEIISTAPITLMKEKRIAPGYYKLLKYKNGFAFKRYEPIEVEA